MQYRSTGDIFASIRSDIKIHRQTLSENVVYTPLHPGTFSFFLKRWNIMKKTKTIFFFQNLAFESLENHIRWCHLLNLMEWIIFNYMSEGLFFTPLGNRTRVPVTSTILLEKYIENNFSTKKTQLTKIFNKLRNALF